MLLGGGMTKKEVYDIYVHLGVFGNYSYILGMYFRDTRCCGFIFFLVFLSLSFFGLWKRSLRIAVVNV